MTEGKEEKTPSRCSWCIKPNMFQNWYWSPVCYVYICQSNHAVHEKVLDCAYFHTGALCEGGRVPPSVRMVDALRSVERPRPDRSWQDLPRARLGITQNPGAVWATRDDGGSGTFSGSACARLNCGRAEALARDSGQDVRCCR